MAATSSTNEDAVGEEDDKPFRLLDLPPEIWTNIIKMAIDEEPTFDHLRIEWECQPGIEPHQPPITRTCRIIRQEILPYFYKTRLFPNESFFFQGYELDQVGRLLKMIGQRNRQALRSVQVASILFDEELRQSEAILKCAGWLELDVRLEFCKILQCGAVVVEVKFL